MLVSVLSHHLLLLVVKINLVAQHKVSVGIELGGPGGLLSLVVSVLLLLVSYLLCSLGHDFLLLLGLEALEVVRHVSVLSVARDGGVSVLSHQVGEVGVGNLSCVHFLLI